MQVWGIMDENTKEVVISPSFKEMLEEAIARRKDGHKVTSVPSQFAKTVYSY